MQVSKTASVLVQLVAYAIAITVAVAVWQLTPQLDDLWRLAVADFAATAFIFLCSVVLNNSSMYDPYWSVKPAVIASGYAMLFGLNELPAILLFMLMMLYNLRLTSNFFRDWPGLKHEDWRYKNFREQFPKAYWLVSFAGIHLFPTIMVYLACLPLYFGMKASFEMNWLGWLGILVTVAAIVIAYVADEQMRSFRKNPLNKGKNMNDGLWKTQPTSELFRGNDDVVGNLFRSVEPQSRPLVDRNWCTCHHAHVHVCQHSVDGQTLTSKPSGL